MKRVLLLSSLVLFILSSFIVKSTSSSSVVNSTNFSQHIAPIFYANCTGCHHTGGVGPFSMIDYQDAYNMRFAIQTSVLNGEMPPWPPDTNYTRFRHERILSSQEISLIDDWVNNGAPEGDPNLAPIPPTYNTNGPQLGIPDLTLSAPHYTSNAFMDDDYVCFTIPSQLLSGKKIRAVEVEPGVPEIVHHVLVYLDTSGNSTPGIENNCMGPLDGLLVGEFAPGSGAIAYPGDQNLVTDSTKVHFYFYPDQINNFRQIEISPILVNFNFCVPPNQQKTITSSFTVPLFAPSLSMYGVFPHMHLIGKSISTYAVLPNNDTAKLINIPDWDFEWQGSYSFPKMLKIPSATKIVGTATYDNTAGNPHNPNTPPQTICAGFNTTDEMFVIYYLYTLYQNGDENLNLDSLMQSGMTNISDLHLENNVDLSIFPNPSNGHCNIDLSLFNGNELTVSLFDLSGKEIKQVEVLKSVVEPFSFEINNSTSAVYIVKVSSNLGEIKYGKIIIE